MSILTLLGIQSAPPAPPRVVAPLPEIPSRYGKPPVQWSQDFGRIMSLPRRTIAASYSRADFDALEAQLRAPAAPCKCAPRSCPTRLLDIQAKALLDAARAGGLLAPIGVGHGKTLVDLLLPFVMGSKRTVLLIPSSLKGQLLNRDWAYYGAHWTLPNLAGGKWFRSGLPALHVLSYNELSSQKSTDVLPQIKPDLIICDEAHNLKDRKSARTMRFLRYMHAHPETRLCALSGTLASRSIKDYAHLSELALKDGSPLPLHVPTIEEWACALDPGEVVAPPGVLQQLCSPGEGARDGFRRRRNDTLGVVSTDESALGTSLLIRKRKLGAVPREITNYISLAHAGERPDGEQFVEQLQIITCTRQLASGFYHRWKFPKVFGEGGRVIEDEAARRKAIDLWFMRRQAWNRELREKLKRPREHLDSPGLLTKAAVRYYQDPPYDGDKPTWDAEAFPDWHAVHRTVEHVTDTVWLSDFVAVDAAKWAREKVGIVWVEFPELGEKIAKLAGIPFYGGGKESSALIAAETGSRSVVASIKAHGTGKNLQHAFARNLVVNPPADGGTWEQLIGRTHRQGQPADLVEVDIYQHTGDLEDAFTKARDYARFIQETDGQPQKLLFADYDW